MRLRRLFKVVALGTVLAAAAFAQSETDLAGLQAKAQRGNAVAQYNLGLAYAQGHGVAADPIEAYVWLSLALENGARGRALDSLTSTLSSAQIETARQHLSERRASLGMKTTAPKVEATTPTSAARREEIAPARTENPRPSAGNPSSRRSRVARRPPRSPACNATWPPPPRRKSSSKPILPAPRRTTSN